MPKPVPTKAFLQPAKAAAMSRAEEPYLRLFVSKRREMPKPVPTKAFLQPAKAAAMSRAEEPYLRLFVSKRKEMPKLVPTKAFLQPAKAAAMCTAPRAETRPPPPTLPFLLAQNLSSKQIAPTDNMWPSCMTSTLMISG